MLNQDHNLDQLMQKPVAMMTGEELAMLISSLKTQDINATPPTASTRHLYHGIAGIAEIFGCSVPTANRIKQSGIIDDAITQVGRKIVIDGDKALALAKAAGPKFLRKAQ